MTTFDHGQWSSYQGDKHYDEDVWNDDGKNNDDDDDSYDDGDGDDDDTIGFHLAVHSDHSDHMNCSGS